MEEAGFPGVVNVRVDPLNLVSLIGLVTSLTDPGLETTYLDVVCFLWRPCLRSPVDALRRQLATCHWRVPIVATRPWTKEFRQMRLAANREKET
ncbi:unnamed protein product [Sphagnum tenellum]